MDIDFLAMVLGFTSVIFQIAMTWPYRNQEYFQRSSYYQSLLRIWQENRVHGSILITSFYTSLASIALLLGHRFL